MPAGEDLLRARALKLLERRSFAEAAEQFRRVARLPGATADDHAHLAQAFAAAGRFAEAEAALNTAIGLAPQAADLHACLGQVLVQAGRPVQAVARFRQAMALEPGHWAAGDLVATRGLISQSVHSWHLPMLGDAPRNVAFADAIAAAVRPDDIVLDIGTGSGLLAMMAARAGARHVYACEMLPDLAELARIVVRDNGYADRITVIAKPSSALVAGIDLAERASLLVTETFDALLIGEGALHAIGHASEHLLAPGARIIPRGGAIRAQVVAFPRLKTLHPLGDLCGFDLRSFAAHGLDKQFYPVVPEIESITDLTAPFDVIRFDFNRAPGTDAEWSLDVTFTNTGMAQALLLWIDLELDADHVLSSGRGGAARHWNPVAFLLDVDRAASAGETATLTCKMGGNVLHFAL